jgi:hypothetical protein
MMSEYFELVGVKLERTFFNDDLSSDIAYTYPETRVPDDYLEAALELSRGHVDGQIIELPIAPGTYHAQGAYMLDGPDVGPKTVKQMASVLEPNFENTFDKVMANHKTVDSIKHWGDILQSGGNVVHAINHGHTLDMGLQHALAYAALKELGVEFKNGFVISQGIARLAGEFFGMKIPYVNALKWPCDYVWLVTPNTSNARSMAVRKRAEFAALSQQQNTFIKAHLRQTQDQGSAFITVAPSGTTNRQVSPGVREIALPIEGTLRLFDHPRTIVTVVGANILRAATAEYSIVTPFIHLNGNRERILAQGHYMCQLMAAQMNHIDPHTEYRLADVPK